MVDLVTAEKEAGRMITLASDSTTRRGVGQFIGQGLHIGAAFPLPLLSINIKLKRTLQNRTKRLAICSGEPVGSLASKFDTLLTDSVEHNKWNKYPTS